MQQFQGQQLQLAVQQPAGGALPGPFGAFHVGQPSEPSVMPMAPMVPQQQWQQPLQQQLAGGMAMSGAFGQQTQPMMSGCPMQQQAAGMQQQQQRARLGMPMQSTMQPMGMPMGVRQPMQMQQQQGAPPAGLAGSFRPDNASTPNGFVQ